ncbi:MAG: WecB/TagA/CpsF family glycosyltransferase [Chloroflexi bacterium]|nr:WecB/TagA/CpsF family glycosyltransferase [Chloroflexota bacterium]
MVKAMHDPELRYLLQESDMATADGMPLVWGARLLGVELEDRVAGADMVPALAERAAQNGYSIYFLGAAPGIAASAAEILQERYPGLTVAGVKSPPYTSVIDMDPGIIEEIKAALAGYFAGGFWQSQAGEVDWHVWPGIRRSGDDWHWRYPGFYYRQYQTSASLMQRMGLEWSYRLIREPGRLWKRYAVDPVQYGAFFGRQWWAMRQGNVPAAVLPGYGFAAGG